MALKISSRLLAAGIAFCVLALNGCSDTPPAKESSVSARTASGPDWLYGGGQHHRKYSTLDQINRETVSDLAVAWTYDTGEDPQAGTMHSTPLFADGTLYVAGPEANIHAIDPATGKRRWVSDFQYPDGTNTWFKGAPRGLMYWSDGEAARLYGTAGHYVYSVDAETGRVDTAFGKNGAIDLRNGLGRDPEFVDAELGSPGAVHGDLIILGSRMGEELPTAPGHIRAYDARTGEMVWIFHTIPQPGEPGHETWPEDAWTFAGGANNWSGMALDEERGIVYLGTGSAASDYYGADRAGDNLYANSILALRARTGELVWHRQIVRHDLWDRDIPAPPTLASLTHDGQERDVLMQITKSGHVWVLDRDTGASLFPLEEIAVPASTLPGEVAAETQTVPTLPEPFARQTLTAQDLTRRTPEAYEAAKAVYDTLDPHQHFLPPSEAGQAIFPGLDGGGEWGGAAFDPQTGLLYVNANEVPWLIRMVEQEATGETASASALYAANCATCHGAEQRGNGAFPALTDIAERRSRAEVTTLIANGTGRMPGFEASLPSAAIEAIAGFVVDGEETEVALGTAKTRPWDKRYRLEGYNKFLDPDGYPAVSPPWGTLTAIDMTTGRHAWRIPFGQYPELVEKGMNETGSENYGGPLVTAGGLVFIGATVKDKTFRAYDKETGALLWSHALPASGVGTPAIYEVDGRQYVVTPAGGARRSEERGASYVAFALPQ